MKKLINILFLSVMFYSCSAHYPQKFEEEKIKPYSKGTLGASLQKSFYDYYDLNIHNPDHPNENEAILEYDFIPRDIRTGSIRNSLSIPVRTLNFNIAGLLIYPFSKSEKENSFNNWDPTVSNILFDVNSIDILPQVFLTKFQYVKDITGYLKGNLTTNFKPPYGSLEASLHSEKDSKSNIQLVTGHFISPLDSLMNDNRTNLTILFNLYNLIKQNPNVEYYYLSEFDGVSVIKLTEEEAKLTGNLNGEINYSVPFVQVNGKIEAKKSIFQKYQSKEWTVIIQKMNNSYGKFEKLYNLNEVISMINTRTINIVSDSKSYVSTNIPNTHTIRIENLKQAYCDRSFWDAQLVLPENIINNFTITKMSPNPNNPQTCDCELTGTPTNQIQDLDDISLEYKLVFRNDNSLFFTIKDKFYTSKEPLIQKNSESLRPDQQNTDDKNCQLRWKVKLSIIDNNSLVDLNRNFEIVEINILKANNQDTIKTIFDNYPRANEKKEIEVYVNSNNVFPLTSINFSTPQIINLVGKVKIPLKSGGTITKEFYYSVIYPIVEV